MGISKDNPILTGEQFEIMLLRHWMKGGMKCGLGKSDRLVCPIDSYAGHVKSNRGRVGCVRTRPVVYAIRDKVCSTLQVRLQSAIWTADMLGHRIHELLHADSQHVYFHLQHLILALNTACLFDKFLLFFLLFASAFACRLTILIEID
jgi:hypothetical protein